MQEKICQRRLLTFKILLEMGIRFSREHLWRLEAAGKFPRRVYLSPQKVAWFEDEILNWLDARDAERETRVYRAHD
jgi:prophage regulatory protein